MAFCINDTQIYSVHISYSKMHALFFLQNCKQYCFYNRSCKCIHKFTQRQDYCFKGGLSPLINGVPTKILRWYPHILADV